MGRIWPWKSVAAVALVVAYSLCAAASCYGRDSPCRRGNSHEHVSSASSDIPGSPLESGSIGLGCETDTLSSVDSKSASVKPSTSSFGTTPRILRSLGEDHGVGTIAGMRLFLVRRSSHPSEAKIHPALSLQRSIERDFHRINGGQARFLYAAKSKASSRSKFRANFPDLVDPGGKKPLTDESKVNTTTVSGLYKFESTVESGVPHGSGEYFMDLYVGTPPRHFSVIIDTGSDLTWVQCDPCQFCYRQEGPVFLPNMSSTYDGLTCNSESCISAGGFGDDVDSCQKGSEKPGVCKYFYYYGDLSNTTGDFALETVTFNVSIGDPLQIEQILFGCGHSNRGLFQGAGGLLGLGQGAISFVSQVGNLFGDKFSYCLVDRDNPYNLGSPLIFGEDKVYARLEPKFQWTPILQNTPIDTFYYVNITGVRVAGELLKIPETAWEIDREGYGGTIVDSGTTLSYFRQEAYDVIRKAFEVRISYPKVTSVPFLSVCYNLTKIENPDFPSFSVTFQDNAVMELPLKNYFIRPDPGDHVYCLALLGVPSKNLNIVGNFQQQNFHIVYDRGNLRVGFAPVECTGIL